MSFSVESLPFYSFVFFFRFSDVPYVYPQLICTNFLHIQAVLAMHSHLSILVQVAPVVERSRPVTAGQLFGRVWPCYKRKPLPNSLGTPPGKRQTSAPRWLPKCVKAFLQVGQIHTNLSG